MSDGITFRSSVNGFNRNEVIKYIELLLKEKEDLSSEIKTLEAQKKAAESELATALEILEQEKQKCSRCDVAQKAEAKLGAAMLDAKRFSETLVRDAEARTSEVFSDASEKAGAAVSSAGRISEMLSAFLDKCSGEVSAVLETVNGIKHSLELFEEELASSAPSRVEQIFSDENVSADNGASDEAPVHEAAKTDIPPTKSGVRADRENTPVFVDDKPQNNEETRADAVQPDPFNAVLFGDDDFNGIIDAPVVDGRFGSFAADDLENEITDEFESINGEAVKVPLFADSDNGSEDDFDMDEDTVSVSDTEDGTDDAQTDTPANGVQGGGFVPDFNFDDDFTIKVSLDD